jgi:hypothetical protein
VCGANLVVVVVVLIAAMGGGCWRRKHTRHVQPPLTPLLLHIEMDYNLAAHAFALL